MAEGAPVEGTKLQDVAMEMAGGLRAVTRTYPFGPEHDVFKVAGRVFLVVTELRGTPIVTMKCEPPHAEALRQEFGTITPGYHMNKKHWISVAAGPGISAELVQELVLNAYELVVEGMPAARRPVLGARTPRPGAEHDPESGSRRRTPRPAIRTDGDVEYT